jgi:hypothetical protein
MTEGTCFGFTVRADRPLRFLRGGTGDALTVRTEDREGPGPGGRIVLSWEPPGVPYRARLWQGAGGYRLWIEGTGWFFIDPAHRRIVMPDHADPIRLEERLWGLPSVLCFLARGDHALHAAAVEVGGGAVLLAGPGRYGKTTLAAAFVDAGHRLLSEDVACLGPGADPVVLPGPAMLRLRHDVASRLLPRGAHEVGRCGDRVHLALDDDLRGDCRPVPLRAIVLLRGDDRGVRIARASGPDVLRDLWALSFHIPDLDDLGRCFSGVAGLAAAVPVWNLHRRMSFDALPATVDAITSSFLAHV